ncbi:hypothetical protein Krad_2387 [Kineococcus radiotolerans SRS30216 = ATCC BAA-149]|uniref:Uncharacterized protein n=2 Tax=Kineococcus radiotolerans TaxID=131568 RepID=A6WAM8_KINRD|nr:hypothetical protein Krad_2387 [Kineococcus radiotolerans SRS30216 = ATCC BAA-149]
MKAGRSSARALHTAQALHPPRHGVVVSGMVHAEASTHLTLLEDSPGDHDSGTATMTSRSVDGPQITAHSPLRARPALRARLALSAVATLVLAGAAFAVRDEPAAPPLSAADELAQDVAQQVVDDVQGYVQTGRIPGELDPDGAAATPLRVNDVNDIRINDIRVNDIQDWLQDPPATYWTGRSRGSWRVLSSDVPTAGGATPPAEATFVLAVYLLSQDTSFVNSSEWGRTCLQLHVEPAAYVVQQQRVACADDVPEEGLPHY